ncbi:endonuclease domain-containing protein [bacterium]|nr:MAG: endonuclease domain-containing protein [bacterium]
MEIHKKSLIPITKKLRTDQTPWETKLWYYLRANRFYGLKFKRQVMIGEYIADFCCHNKKLIIELDGGQHCETEGGLKDQEREKYFKKYGYKVLRFWNNTLDENLDGVLETIKDNI